MEPVRKVISICGGAGSGKSQLAKAVASRLGSDRCSRVPTDYFLRSATQPLADYLLAPLEYDWDLLGRVLALPPGTETSTPDFDFETFQRRSQLGGRKLTIREVMLIDSMPPYPQSDLVILISAPSEMRRMRLMSRDQVWGTAVAKR